MPVEIISLLVINIIYNKCIADGKLGVSKHIIFDFAEQLTMPSTMCELGPMYFAASSYLASVTQLNIDRQTMFMMRMRQ